MTPVERLTAALHEAEKRLDAATPGEWSADHRGGRTFTPDYGDEWWAEEWICAPEGELFPVGDDEWAAGNADLIVSVVNRERAQIQHARDVLALAEEIRAWGGYSPWADMVIASLLAVWCPEPTP